MQNTTDSRVEEVMRRERSATKSRWYRRTWAQPLFWLHPTLRDLSKSDRDQLIDDAKLEARSSVILIALIVAWLLLCVASWVAIPASTRNSLGLTLMFVPALGVGLARYAAIHMAIRKNLAIRHAFEASKRSR